MMYQPQEPVQRPVSRLRKSSKSMLLQRHPVLVPLVLLGGSLLAGIAALLFSVFVGVVTEDVAESMTTLCLSVACVLGVAGVLAGITGMLELIDRSGAALLTMMLSKFKE